MVFTMRQVHLKANFVSMCHKGAEIDKTLAVAEEAFKIISETL